MALDYDQIHVGECSNDVLKPLWASQLGQDKLVAGLFNFMKGEYFIEIGRGNGTIISNTYTLEHFFEWRGLLVEPGCSLLQLALLEVIGIAQLLLQKRLELLHRQAQELVGLQILIHIGLNDVLHREFPVADYLLLEHAALQHPAALGVHRLALVVHHLVVFEHLLTDVVVVGLDILLGPLQRAGIGGL